MNWQEALSHETQSSELLNVLQKNKFLNGLSLVTLKNIMMII